MSEENQDPSPEDYRRQDLIKAGKILLYSAISAIVVTAIFYYFPIN